MVTQSVRLVSPPEGVAPVTPGEVALWAVFLDRSEAELARMRDVLTLDELGRAERFRFRRHANRFVAGRATLRSILGSYLGQDPAHVPLTVTEHGKPVLADPAHAAIHFNLSHSRDVGLYAVSCSGPVGVDLEPRVAIPGIEHIAARFFTPGEHEAFSALPVHMRNEGFLLWWTRKEALLKATGEGISEGMTAFDVAFDPRRPARVLTWPDGDPAAWTLMHLRPLAGYVGALAVRAPVTRVRWVFHLDDLTSARPRWEA